MAPVLICTAHARETGAAGAVAEYPWSDPSLSPDVRADLVVKAMTREEKLRLVLGYFGSVKTDPAYSPPPHARMGSAGFVPGIPRLGLPPQWITDAGLGVATQRDSTDAYRERTALPSGLATAATWNSALARLGGAMIGSEARASGFNVMLAGGIDLMRDPRNGRNFEYAGEDPLLAGNIVGAEVAGIQSNHVIATIKHWALNDQETGRKELSVDIADDQARMSDFLAFELAIERGSPGAVMCGYNRVETVYACENGYLLDEVLKTDWHYPGYVMSDWGAVHSTEKSALAGLDQESAFVFDGKPYFGKLLKKAVADGRVPRARLDDMARRILRSMFAEGLVDYPITNTPIDFAADAKVAQADEEEGIVLLKNKDGALPLARTAKRVLVIGSHADRGVISGGGSSTVFPAGGNAVPGLGPQDWPGPVVYLPSSPLAAIMARIPQAEIHYVDGRDAAKAAKLAAEADVVIVFANQWATEDADVSLTLPDGQNDLIATVAAANPHTVVVLETGGPVLMPWLDKVAAVIEAWYPGSGGGEAIARVLFGEVDASGRLPATFPRSLDQLPRPELTGTGVPANTPFSVSYNEGAAVGYKWFEKNGLTPLFPFGYGLSYTRFVYSGLETRIEDGRLNVSFNVTNIGDRPGKDVPQIYIGPKAGGWEAPRRLAGWSKVQLPPGGSTTVSLTIDPRLTAMFDTPSKTWKTAEGDYLVSLGASSADAAATAEVHLAASILSAGAVGSGHRAAP
ncbi:MAG: glycoside hydrolase family 3 C-terminal domain-containing protein [Alphaproteobacteria bacterium]|nr:glycoside hydrolase family 3 C-terminal domain-containing protein [Alphaproteobacteria bacterium]